MEKPFLTKEQIASLEAFGHSVDKKPFILSVSSSKINPGRGSFDASDAKKAMNYEICSACYCIIDKSWDHDDWCELFEDEPVSKWLKDGKQNE